MKQIQSDCTFLMNLDICDYSLLVGIHNLDPDAKVEESEVKTARNMASNYRYSEFQRDYGGILGVDDQGNQLIYYFGIIDILTAYNLKKMTERQVKSFIYDSNAISALPPKLYMPRFLKYIMGIMS